MMFDKKIVTKKIELNNGITGTEYRKGTNPILVKATLTCKAWPSEIVLSRIEMGSVLYRYSSNFALPKDISGYFQNVTIAYEALADRLGLDACKSMKFETVPEVQKTLLDEIEEREKAQAPVATWSESYRVGYVHVHESRLKDGSTMAIFEVHEPVSLSLKSIKPRTTQHYIFQSEDIPFNLRGQQFTTVRNMAQAIHAHVSIEAMA